MWGKIIPIQMELNSFIHEKYLIVAFAFNLCRVEASLYSNNKYTVYTVYFLKFENEHPQNLPASCWKLWTWSVDPPLALCLHCSLSWLVIVPIADPGGGDDHHSIPRPLPEECNWAGPATDFPLLHPPAQTWERPHFGYSCEPHQHAIPGTGWTLMHPSSF